EAFRAGAVWIGAMIEEQRDQPAICVHHSGCERGEAELDARLGTGVALEQEASSVESSVRAGDMEQGFTALVARVGREAMIEHTAESGSVADARVEECSAGERH